VSYRRGARAPRFRFGLTLLVLLALAAISGLVYVSARMVTAPKTVISFLSPFDRVGRQTPLAIDVDDASGLRAVSVVLVQGDKRHPILEQTFDVPQTSVKVRWAPGQAPKIALAEGKGEVVVEARNASWGNWMQGRVLTERRPFEARTQAPRLEVLTGQHYVNQGGCDAVVYKVTPAEVESGVAVGDRFFRGFPVPGSPDPAVRIAVFAYPYDAAPGTAVRLRARDDFGNEALAGFTLKVFPKTFRTRDLPVDDTFLNKVVPEIVSQTPSLTDQGDLLKNYLAINRDLRKANNQTLTELAQKSKPERTWTLPFQQLGGSSVEAQFADHRRYMYEGQEVDRQDHLGYDLATTANAPVTAANDGVVVLAEYFGIYGNAVVIDHGYGLLSLYGHLSRMEAKVGDAVKRSQTVGYSGATGLAGGDHLHFSMVLLGEQVDAREWFDAHWLEDRLFVKLRQFGAPAPSPSPAASAAP
jgi:murein DD-endopeptidase MepM/ murein hydrolase activator NlpD